ncbi:MAG: hypothetical protein MSIBF_01295 [Candidatus Altiarchaeales archaeon IMC4]|nr:MAG: hypothetical protein MSIBF_01295 [Candidatus Altiarchaeales archaeon IMC4]
MTWHAIESIEPAFDKTIWLLFKPFALRLWLKLALVAFLMGGGGGGNLGNFSDFGDRGNSGNFDDFDGLIMDNIGLVTVIVGIILLIILAFSYVGAVMSFVFLDSVVKSNVEIVAGFKKFMGKGFWLFVFDLTLGIALLSCIAVPVIVYVFVLGGGFSWVLLALAIAALISLIIVYSIISSFTADFVVPYMHKGMGLIEGWRRLIVVLRKNIAQTAIYVLMKIGLGIASGILSIIIMILGLIIMAIPGIIIVILLAAIAGVIGLSGAASWSMFPVLLAIGIVLLVAILLFIAYLFVLATLPIPVFFRHYSLIFLTSIDEGFKIFDYHETALQFQDTKTRKSFAYTKKQDIPLEKTYVADEEPTRIMQEKDPLYTPKK